MIKLFVFNLLAADEWCGDKKDTETATEYYTSVFAKCLEDAQKMVGKPVSEGDVDIIDIEEGRGFEITIGDVQCVVFGVLPR